MLGNKCLRILRNFHGTLRSKPSWGVPKRRCSENILEIYRRTPMPKSDFNKVAYWDRTSAWVFSCKFAIYFQNSVSLRIQSECGKIRTRKSSVSGHFSRCGFIQKWINLTNQQFEAENSFLYKSHLSSQLNDLSD